MVGTEDAVKGLRTKRTTMLPARYLTELSWGRREDDYYLTLLQKQKII
jgi:hypothetical protein